MKQQEKINHYIGGFFEMALPDAVVHKSVLSEWGIDLVPARGFINARSALAALLAYLKPARIFLPAFSCISLFEACADHHVIFYPIKKDMSPDSDFLNSVVKDGDVVLAINYFGKAPSQSFLEFVSYKKDVLFIEDCAQSLSTGVAAWGDWRLFSPRKLVGVADGGFIIQKHAKEPNLVAPISLENSSHTLWTPALLRWEDKKGTQNSLWYPANQDHEKSMKVEDTEMSYLSYHLLSKLDVLPLIEQRQKNYQTLHQFLSPWALLPDKDILYAPLGFPLHVPYEIRDDLITFLVKNNIFPAVHWRELPSPADQFHFEHHLSQEVVTLPCDHRYDPKDMRYVGEMVKNFMMGSL